MSGVFFPRQTVVSATALTEHYSFWLILLFWCKGWEVLLPGELGCAFLTNASGPLKAEESPYDDLWHKQVICVLLLLRWNPSFWAFRLHFFLSPSTRIPKSWLCECGTCVWAGREDFVVSCGACLKLSAAPCQSALGCACSSLLLTRTAFLTDTSQDICGHCSRVLLLSKDLTCNWL